MKRGKGLAMRWEWDVGKYGIHWSGEVVRSRWCLDTGT